MQSNQKENSSTGKTKTLRSRNYQERSVPKFLKKVFYILEENKHNDLLSWSADGLSIIIKKPTEFAEKVLPMYFKHNNFASFIRQLNMYKFKKRKCYQYDHVYSHEMFQRGKIDLLRNIQRKNNEPIQVEPMDSNEIRDESNLDVDQLMQENMYYKRVHKTLATQIQFIESKMKELKGEVSNLYADQMQSQANEDFLKKIIKALTKVYGYDNIAKVIELDVEDSKDSTVPQEPNIQASSYQEASGTNGFDERSVFQLSNSSDEDVYYEDCCPEPLEYEQNKPFQVPDREDPCEQYRIIYPTHNPMIKQCQLQEKSLSQLLYNNGFENPADLLKLSNPHSNRSWIKEQERKNVELLANGSSNYHVTDTKMNSLGRNKPQIFYGADF